MISNSKRRTAVTLLLVGLAVLAPITGPVGASEATDTQNLESDQVDIEQQSRITLTSHGNFSDDFEEYSLGTSDLSKWDAGTDSSYLNVTSERAANGSQSLHMNDSYDSTESVWMNLNSSYEPSEVRSVSWSVYASNFNNSDFGHDNKIEIRNSSDVSIVSVRIFDPDSGDGGDGEFELQYHNGSQWVTADTAGFTDEWTRLRVDDLDPANDTFSLSWGSTSTTGNLANLSAEGDIPSSYGSDLAVGANNQAYYDDINVNIDENLGQTVSGQVVDQNGDPVPANTTVEVWGTTDVPFDTNNETEQIRLAENLQDNFSDPIPDQWDPNYDPEDHQSGTYMLAHEASDWSNDPSRERFGQEYDVAVVDEQIDDPRLQISEDSCVILSTWDTTDSESIPNTVINSFPGTPQQEDIVVEQLYGSGESINTQTHEPEVVAQTSKAYGTITNDHYGVHTCLPEGVYNAYPDGSPEQGYTFTVGDVSAGDETQSLLLDNVLDFNGQLTERSQRMNDLMANDSMIRQHTTTDENGSFAVNVPSSVVTVQIQAYRADGEILRNTQNATMQDLRDAAEGDYNGTFILPAPEPQRANPPAENVTVRTVRSPEVPNFDPESYNELLEWFENQRFNETVAEMESGYRRLENMSREELESRYNDARRLVEGYDPAKEYVLEETGNDEISDASDLSRAELINHIGVMESALFQADRTEMQEPEINVNVDVDAPDTSDEVSEISGSFPVDDGVDEDNVAVDVIWSDGDVTQMPDEYWSVSGGSMLTDNTVEIEDYPIESSDAAVANIRVRATSDNGVGEETARVTNPHFDGSVPGINAIDFNTLRPGTDERVTFRLRAEDGTGYGQIEVVEVFGPDGTQADTTINRTRGSVRFTPTSQGAHFVRVEYSNTGGTNFVETFQIRAHESSSSHPPTMRVSDGSSGTHALVGEGFRSAEVEQNGDTIQLAGVIPGDANAPGQIVVQPQTAMQSSTDELEVRVSRGEDRETVRSHMTVEIHLETFEDDTLIWVNGEAMTHDGSTPHGEVEQRDDNKHVILTETNAEGVATVELKRDPSTLQRLNHWRDHTLPDLNPLMILDILADLWPSTGDLTTSTTGPAASEAMSAPTPSTGVAA